MPVYGEEGNPHDACRERIAELEAEFARLRRDHEAMEAMRTSRYRLEPVEYDDGSWWWHIDDCEGNTIRIDGKLNRRFSDPADALLAAKAAKEER